MLFLFLCRPVLATEETREISGAKSVAVTWLAKLDADDFSECWNELATGPKATIPRWKWNISCKMGRFSLGKPRSRKLNSSESTTTSPGGHPGRYVLLDYETVSEKSGVVHERVTVMQDQDGQWRVAGYKIQ